MSIVKHFVSKKKRRYQQNGYDLDLTYITDNIVAMGYPSERLEGLLRNKADDVIRFFDQNHQDSYKVYNLCSERKYDPSKFHNRVAEYPFEDHNAPRFEMLKPCCEDISDWLRGNGDRNVVAIHCKAGKGRTGVIICSYLLHIGSFTDTKDALQFYGERRTQNAKGVTIPSQRRYVYYYSFMLKNKLTYSPTPLLLKSITLVGVPTFTAGVCSPMFIVRQGQGAKIYQSEPMQDVKKTDRVIKIILPKPLPICGDLRIEFVHVGKISNKKEKMFQYWFNTFFIYNACPTEEQEALEAHHSGQSYPAPIMEHPEKDGAKYGKKSALTPNDSAASLPLPKSNSSSNLVETADKKSSPERAVGIGLTKRKRGSVRRSFSEFPSDTVHPVYCEEFNLNLPKWELDRAHKDKDCKQYPDSFRVITSMANPMTQDPDDFNTGSGVPNTRHELVSSDTDLTEDSDDDDVMGIPDMKNKPLGATAPGEKKRKANQKHSKGSTTTTPLNFSGVLGEEPPVTQRAHSNAISSFSPISEIPSPISETHPPRNQTNLTKTNAQSQAPTNQVQTPVNQHPNPNTQVQAPVNQFQAPVNQTQAPVNQFQAPVNQTQAPVNQIQAPVNQTQAPVNQFQAPVNQTQAPVNQIQAPVNQTQAPVNQTQAPVNQIQAPVNQTQAPVNQFQAPVNQFQAPVNQFQAPVNQFQAPVNQIQAPVNQFQVPVNRTQSPSHPDPPLQTKQSPSPTKDNLPAPPIPPKSEVFNSVRPTPGAKGPKEVSL